MPTKVKAGTSRATKLRTSATKSKAPAKAKRVAARWVKQAAAMPGWMT